MVNGPTTPIPVKAKPSSTDPVVPPVTMGTSVKSSFTSHCTQFSLTNYSVNSDGSSPSQSKINNASSQTVKAFGLTKVGPELQSTCYKEKKKVKIRDRLCPTRRVSSTVIIKISKCIIPH